LPEGFLSLPINSAQLVACGVIVLLTGVNIRGLREGVWVQNLFTVLKMAALAALIVAGLYFGLKSPNFIPPAKPIPTENLFTLAFLGGMAVALSKALFAYDAWYTVTFVAEEVRDTDRTLPRSLIWGTVVVIVLYLLANLAYLAVLPIDQIAGVKEERIVQAMGERLFGNVGAVLMILAVLISTFGCLNGLLLGGARVCYAMAREGLFLRSCGRLRPKANTPAVALVYQGIVTIALTLTGSYSGLLTYTMFASVFFVGLMVAAIYRLRSKYPDLPRPFRCWGYPATPAVFLAMCVAFLICVFIDEPLAPGFGILLMLAGIPFYVFWRKRGANAESSSHGIVR
jgi:APA family basic amino acid/polyamine antiporter